MAKSFHAADYDQEKSDWHIIKTLGQYLWQKGSVGANWRLLFALCCLFIAKGFTASIPIIYKHAIDSLSLTQSLIVVPVALIIGYGLARVGSVFFAECRDFLFINVSQQAMRHAAMKAFTHLHRLSLAFHLDRQTGGLSRVIERALKGIEFVLAFMTFNIVPTLFEIFLVCGILLYKYNWYFAAITFLTISTYILFTLVVTEWRLKYRRQMNKMDTVANTKAIDSLLNFETVKYFGNEAFEASRYDESLAEYQQAAIGSQRSLSVLNLGQGVLIGAGLVAVMYLAARGVKLGKLTVGDFVLVNTYLLQLYQPLNFLGFVYRQMKSSLVDMNKMFELLNVDQEIKDKPGASECEAKKLSVTFDKVGFAYHRDRTILSDLNFSIEPGKTLALVGASGSGKSTIARLLFRFYDVNAGVILLNDTPIDDFTQASVRAKIGVVPQDTVLFNDTIGYNIAYGRPGATQDAIVDAAKRAHIHDFITRLPEGYETRVGERGLKLSGGEKQRVAIARIFLKNPPVLIFDEATSALDSHTEKSIQGSLNQIAEGRTTLVIAHRLSTIIEADEIIVLQEGRVAERGTHHELLQQNGEYAALWTKQQTT